MDEFTIVKYYESVKEAFSECGLVVQPTYRTFNITKGSKVIAQCRTVDGLNSWLEAYRYCNENGSNRHQ